MPLASLTQGESGAVAAAHPLAVHAALEIFAEGGNAADAAVAAQAVLCVVLPEACGLGGDGLAIVLGPDGGTEAIHGAGAAPGEPPAPSGPGGTVTVPGVVAAWGRLVGRHGRLDLATDLAPALRAASDGVALPDSTATARLEQRARLVAGGAEGWDLLTTGAGEIWRQPALAAVLDLIAAEGDDAFYRGAPASWSASAVREHGGTLGVKDFERHETRSATPIKLAWNGGRLLVQPPMSQGVLLAIAAHWFERHHIDPAEIDHLGAESIAAAFEARDRVAEGAALLEEPLEVDPERASRRWGARAYLHTAGVATADAEGMVVSSLVSVFDDFGSAVFVPEGGFVLNNRAEGFGAPPNDLRAGALPVHTLAPAVLIDQEGDPVAMATPGADGQVQTLLQILLATRYGGTDLPAAIAAPRWRGEGGRLLIEEGHPGRERLAARGHRLESRPFGDEEFGALVLAGVAQGAVWAAGDHRREVASGAE